MPLDGQQSSGTVETPAVGGMGGAGGAGYSDLPSQPSGGAATLSTPASPHELGEVLGRSRPMHRRRTPTRLLSATGSLVVHALLLVALAAVVWRTTSLSSGPARDVSISFDIPTLGDAPTPVAGRPESEPPPREVRLDLDPPPTLLTTASEAAPLSSLVTEPAMPIPSEPGAHGERTAPEFVVATTGSVPSAAADRGGAAGAGGVVFAGLGASNARSVVYVVDASGSMVTSLPFVIAELRRSVSMLAPTQKFGVVLFRRMPDGRSGLEVFAPVLVRATASAQERLAEWLESVQPSGRSVPLEGLERAIAYQPDAVFLLSRAIERSGGDGWETASGQSGARGLASTLARIDTLNPLIDGRRAVVIQTIQFLDDDPTGIMQEIGRVHGSRVDGAGKLIAGYRVIRRGEELGQPGAER